MWFNLPFAIKNLERVRESMVERPNGVSDFHEQDWLIVIEALMHYSSPVDPQSGAMREFDLSDPRRALAPELAGVIADHIDVPEGDIQQHIDEEWDGSER